MIDDNENYNEFNPKDIMYRMLQDNVTTTDDDINNAEESELTSSNDSEVLKSTLAVYGSFFIVVLILFSYLRQKYPRVYNLRTWVQETNVMGLKHWNEDMRSFLADKQYGYINWLWKLFAVSDTDMMNECGMDALCFIRLLDFGIKLSLVGMLNACWLIPVYYTAEESTETSIIDDNVVEMSVSNLPSGSARFVATVLGAYVVFGFTMHSILKEFQWFYDMRFQFLSSKARAQNYSVYVRNVPSEYLTTSKFNDFFQASSGGDVVDAKLAVTTKNLSKQVAKRDAIVEDLQHQINIEEVNGETPLKKGVNVIDTLFKELTELNRDITKNIDKIEHKNAASSTAITEERLSKVTASNTSGGEEEHEETYKILEDTTNLSSDDLGDALSKTKNDSAVSAEIGLGLHRRHTIAYGSEDDNNALPKPSTTSATIVNDADAAGAQEDSNADGQPLSAGFVTFKTLQAAQNAKQAVQYRQPFAMEVLEAPQPEDVLWSNVGRTHHDLQVVKLLSLCLTTAICVFWTIPMAFISSLSSVEGMRNQFEFIDNMLEKNPWMEIFLALIAPVVLIVVNVLLKIILRGLSMLEGPVSMAAGLAGSFFKLSCFMIIQTFFVTSLSGGLLDELSNIAQEPAYAVELLAQSLPSQSTFFIQLLLVDTCLGMGIELLRVSAIGMAWIRSLVGPNLTEKEKNSTWMGLRPLADPTEFEQDFYWSMTVLYFMVYFVYATVAPLTTFFMGICFIFRSAGYRHQFIYVYKIGPDSGGKLWVSMIKIVIVCMIIAEVTIVGLLALKKSAVASALMIPLFIITLLFNSYICQQHYRMTENLPVSECLVDSMQDKEEGSIIEYKYTQLELQERELLPNNLTPERAAAQGLDGCLVLNEHVLASSSV